MEERETKVVIEIEIKEIQIGDLYKNLLCKELNQLGQLKELD